MADAPVRKQDLLDFGGWFDELPSARRKSVEEGAVPFRPKKSPAQVLPLEGAGKWGLWDLELEDGKKKLLEAKTPFYFASLGDAELCLVASGFSYSSEETSARLRACGLSRSAVGLRREFVEALFEATLLGLHQRWAPVTDKTALILSMTGFPMPPANAVEVHLPYRMLSDGSLFGMLSGKRVALVGDKADQLAALLRSATFQKAYSHLGPIGEMEVCGTFKTRGKSATIQGCAAGGSWLDLNNLTDWAGKTSFDIALLACGGVANIVGRRLAQMGKSSFDVGFVFEALLGHSQRTIRPILRDMKWK